MDLTYIPMARGFVYFRAVADWFSRSVLSSRLSITMEVVFCIEAVEEALARYGQPAISKTDKGSHFTSLDSTAVLKKAEISISMDGKGADGTKYSSNRSGSRSNVGKPTYTSTKQCPKPASAPAGI